MLGAALIFIPKLATGMQHASWFGIVYAETMKIGN